MSDIPTLVPIEIAVCERLDVWVSAFLRARASPAALVTQLLSLIPRGSFPVRDPKTRCSLS